VPGICVETIARLYQRGIWWDGRLLEARTGIRQKQNFDQALQEAFGVTYEHFDKDWRAWLKAKYG
jgi:hypothetical protein